MDAEPKVIDLSFSDNDDSDPELLSLQERIARYKKPNEKSFAKKVTSSLLKRKILSVPDKVPAPSREDSDDLSREDSDDDKLKLPSLEEVLGIQHEIQSSNNSKEIQEVQKDHKIVYSKYRTDILGLQFTVNPSNEEFNEKAVELPKRAKKIHTKVVDIDKEAAKNEKNRLREEKKQEKELAKALKASEKEIQKSKKPEECFKGMKIIIDRNLIDENQSEDIFCALDEGNVKYVIEENIITTSILWCRKVYNINVENNQVIKEEKEELENVSVIFIPNATFIRMTCAFLQKSKGISITEPTLLDYVANLKEMFPHLALTCVVVGLDNGLELMKKQEIGDCDLWKKKAKQVSKTVIEEATIEVQLQTFVNFTFLKSMREFGELLVRFSKAIAEAPQRREKQEQKNAAFSWYADADSSHPVKIGRDGSELMKLWQQQIQQFNNVGPEVAEAIATKYPSLQILIKAYKECSSKKEAETLLQDIVVRRNYGPLGTQRRVGPELSYKMYLFFTSTDGNQVLQR